MIVTSEFACQDLVELVTEYLDGMLTGDRRAAFEAHLAGCPYCQEYLQQMRVTIDLTGSIGADDLSPAALTALMDAFRDWKDERGDR